MQWPFPAENQDPWYDSFQDMVTEMDASGYAAREDRNIFMGKGGIFTWDAGSGLLTWDATLEIYSSLSGFRLDVPAQSVSLQDGQLFYVDLVRAPTSNLTVAPVVVSQTPNTDSAYAIAIRRGTELYFRFGTKMISGDSFAIFEGGASLAPDTYERAATFSVPDGSSTLQAATIGRVTYAGSLIGLSAEITEAVTSGTVDVTVKIGGAAALTVQLNTSFPTSRQVTVASGVNPVVQNSAITVEVDPTAYGNGSGFAGGVTVNVAFLGGVGIVPADIPDASGTLKGITKLSLNPSIANDPIAVGDNDTRVDTWNNPTGTKVQLLDAADPVHVGTVVEAVIAAQKVTIQDATLPGLTIKSDNASGVEMKMFAGKGADPTPAGLIGTVSNDRLQLVTNNTPFWRVETSGNLLAETDLQRIAAGIIDVSQEPSAGAAKANYIEGGVGSNAAVSAANKGRLRYNETSDRWQVSENAGGYVDMLGGGAVSSFERHASFAVAVGTATQEATLGRITFSGSVIGLSIHCEDARTAGSITINVKKNGVTNLTADIDGINTETVFATAPQGTYTIAQDDEITVEVATTGYDNTPSLPTGMVVNVTMTDATGLTGDPNVALLNAAQTWTAGQAISQFTLTAATNVPVNAALSSNFQLLLNQNVTIDNPTNVIPGSTINIAIRQDGGGTHTVSFGSAYKFPGGTPTVTATGNAEDIISCYVRTETAGTATVMLCSIAQDHT